MLCSENITLTTLEDTTLPAAQTSVILLTKLPAKGPITPTITTQKTAEQLVLVEVVIVDVMASAVVAHQQMT